MKEIVSKLQEDFKICLVAENAFSFMIRQIKCYICQGVMFVQKWEAIFQMIYSVTYSEKYLLINI